jgi:4-aminobutyrate aminotransferase-like enzyme
MTEQKTRIQNITLSLSDLVGNEYIKAVCKVKAFLENRDIEEFLEIANEKVEFFPSDFQKKIDRFVDYTGKNICSIDFESSSGAGTKAFNSAFKKEMAPLSACGFTRIGEDGRAYLTAKSEHYHVPLGHNFPGYRLIENAVKLGIPNATHNNTRGHITRLLETELIRIVNGIKKADKKGLNRVLESSDPNIINRVLNLETGSIAVEASIKMMLSRFFRLNKTSPKPKYYGLTPVFIVIADDEGGKEANYHGTTLITQFLRGMWPDLLENMEENDIPVLIDEIQSCLWSPEIFTFIEYGLKPDFVSVGKGFPGGQYPASKLLSTSAMDNLDLFGALVTNGQEELASLTYLITMAFAEANKEYSIALGDYYEDQVRKIGLEFGNIITKVEGSRHLTSIFFNSADRTVDFASFLNERCIDISAQTYKADCPPSALTKIPLISTFKMIDFIIDNMRDALVKINNQVYSNNSLV